MANEEPVAELEPQFSSDGATPTPWVEARGRMAAAEVYWLATVRPDGRPHVMPGGTTRSGSVRVGPHARCVTWPEIRAAR
jgi:hypothetical protein